MPRQISLTRRHGGLGRHARSFKSAAGIQSFPAWLLWAFSHLLLIGVEKRTSSLCMAWRYLTMRPAPA